MKKIIFVLILSIVSNYNTNAQTTEKIIEKNKSIVCNCINNIDHIDSLEDLGIKFQNCLKPSKKDSSQLQKNGHLETYKQQLETVLFDSCPDIKEKSQLLIQNYRINLANYNYDLEKPYKKIEEKIIGGYSLAFGHHSPEGSPKLFIYPKNRYAIISFGDVQAGTWRVVKGKKLHLIPNKTKYPFTVYGRHNPKIKDSTKTSFLGDDFSYDTLINYGELEEKPLLTPIFNLEANCFSFPFKETISNIYNKISLAYNVGYGFQGDPEINIHTFNNDKKFNDFVIFEHTKMNSRAMTIVVTIDDNTLTFEKGQVTSKSPLDNISDEDNLFLTNIMKVKETPSFVYYNSGYNSFPKEEINSESYTFDKELNTFVYKYDCTGGDCLENDYHNPSQVNKYELLVEVSTHKKQFEIAEKSVIYTVCD